MNSYIPIAVMIVVATVVALAMVGGSVFLGPKKPSPEKEVPYECGMTPVGTARERFPIKFYLIAMLFIVFDIETIFLYPWAVNYGTLGSSLKVFNLIEMSIFVIILFVGYFYILGKGALDWDESERAVNPDVITAKTRAPRPALRYGNEKSGLVDAGKAPVGPRVPTYGASSQELYQRLPNQSVPVLGPEVPRIGYLKES